MHVREMKNYRQCLTRHDLLGSGALTEVSDIVTTASLEDLILIGRGGRRELQQKKATEFGGSGKLKLAPLDLPAA